MWEAVGGWEKVGEIEPTINDVTYSITVTSKFNNISRLNEAKLRLKYVEVP
jgi:hypothetical protein